MKSLDFSALTSGKISFADLISEGTHKDLRPLISDLFETLQAILAQATDADVTFVPHDAQSKEGDERGWTLGHSIVHLTAILEDRLASAAMQARGVHLEGRLLYETPWERVHTMQQVQSRLHESRRMCNAFLDAWPDMPHLDITIAPIPYLGLLNAVQMSMLGIVHAQTHFDPLRETIRQSKDSQR